MKISLELEEEEMGFILDDEDSILHENILAQNKQSVFKVFEIFPKTKRIEEEDNK